jgi:hypothetical protein
MLFVYAAQNHLPIPIGKNISQNLDDYLGRQRHR